MERTKGTVILHGTITGYAYWKCRCKPCTEAKRVSNRSSKARAAYCKKHGISLKVRTPEQATLKYNIERPPDYRFHGFGPVKI